MSLQLKIIANKRNKALKVLMDTKKSLMKCAELTRSFIEQNQNEINVKLSEVNSIATVNASLEAEMSAINSSILEADKIINPTMVN
jgi:hypothetical protein